jgi:ATP-dependent Clp protease ATP-binding subunit ClpX
VPPQGGRKHPNQEMLRIDTTNILFIVGGAFVGLERIISQRVAKHPMGFGADVQKVAERDLQDLYKQLHPDDLVKFGLIPEFVGRLPIAVPLNDLKVEDLEHILTTPKNSIIRQYQASLRLDDVDLIFEPDAIKAIAEQALIRKTGARGLRAIVENIMMNIMFELPSIKGSKKVVITRDVITQSRDPEIILEKKSA